MINRREALLGMGAVVLGAAIPWNSALASLLEQPAAGENSDGAIDQRLRQQLAVMSKRANSEEGVPVILACVDMVPVKGTNKPPVPRLSPWNNTINAEFKQTVAAWERVNPNSKEADVGKVIQVMAARDFASGGRETASL